MRHSLRSRWWLVLAAALLVTACGQGGSQNTSPIKVGFLLPETGVFTPNGQDERAGWNLGLKDAGSTVDGRKIQTTFVDDASDPNQGLTAARQLVQTQNVDMLIGPVAANVGLAIRGFVASSGVPTLYPSACSVELASSEKAQNLILTGWTCDQPSLPFGKYVYDTLGYHHITTIGMDYAFGWQVIGGFLSTFKAAGGTVDKEIWAPFNAPDYSPYVSQISSSTQAVFALTAGVESVRFTDAYKSFGLAGRIPLLGGGTVTDYSVMGSENPSAILGAVTTLQYADGLDTTANTKFVNEYRKATGKYPSYYADSGYATAVLMVDALKKVKANTKDRSPLIKALKTTTFHSPGGPVSIDQSTNSPIQNIYVRKVEMVNGAPRNVVIHTFKNVKPWGPLQQSKWEQQAPHYTRTSS